MQQEKKQVLEEVVARIQDVSTRRRLSIHLQVLGMLNAPDPFYGEELPTVDQLVRHGILRSIGNNRYEPETIEIARMLAASSIDPVSGKIAIVES